MPPEESVTGSSEESAAKKTRKARKAKKKEPRIRRMVYKFNEETSLAVKKTAEYTGRTHRYVAALVIEKLREAERSAIHGLVARVIDRIQFDATQAERADIEAMEHSPLYVGPPTPSPEELDNAK